LIIFVLHPPVNITEFGLWGCGPLVDIEIWPEIRHSPHGNFLRRSCSSIENTDMAAPYPVDISPLRTFSPLASEPPKSFLQDLSPDTPRADCLLLGCGDPRGILFSLFYDQKEGIVSYTC
jgi:hypothetical protein